VLRVCCLPDRMGSPPIMSLTQAGLDLSMPAIARLTNCHSFVTPAHQETADYIEGRYG
jgi:hypothetical protein